MSAAQKLAMLAGIPGVDAVVVPTKPEVGFPQAVTLDEGSPAQGDDQFYRYFIPGSVALFKNGSYWILEHISESGLVRLRNQWYTREEVTVTQDVLRKTIFAWCDPMWVQIPPLATQA